MVAPYNPLAPDCPVQVVIVEKDDQQMEKSQQGMYRDRIPEIASMKYLNQLEIIARTKNIQKRRVIALFKDYR